MITMMQNNELSLWNQKPSNKKNITVFILLIVIGLIPYFLLSSQVKNYILLPKSVGIQLKTQYLLYLITLFCAIKAGILYLINYTTKYELTSERIMIHSGILTRYSHQMELYRVKDYVLIAPLKYRIFGLSKINLVTADPTQKLIVLDGIYDGETVLKAIRDYVELRRDAKNGIYQVF